MQKKEQTLCSFSQKDTRLQLVEVYPNNTSPRRYHVRLNRKIVSNSISEYNERKTFAQYCQNIVLQLKIYYYV